MAELKYTEEHEIFRGAVRRFFEQEFSSEAKAWNEAGKVPRSAWQQAAEIGLLCPTIGTEYGGAGADILHAVILLEEQIRSGSPAIGLNLHNNVVAGLIERNGSEYLKKYCLPRMANGEWIGAFALSEPHVGGDLAAIRTTAELDGDEYVLHGRKTLVGNGYSADVVIVVAKTNTEPGNKDINLLLVDATAAGFKRGPLLKTIGQGVLDSAELFFHNVRVPKTHLLGGEGTGSTQLSDSFPLESLMAGVAAVTVMEHAIELTTDYTRDRMVFGKPVLHYQNTRFKLAEALAEATIARVFLEQCLNEYIGGKLTRTTSAMLKWWTAEMVSQIVDDCLQFHGGYGYMLEYPIARLWQDSRGAKTCGGSTEIMKEIIAVALDQPACAP